MGENKGGGLHPPGPVSEITRIRNPPQFPTTVPTIEAHAYDNVVRLADQRHLNSLVTLLKKSTCLLKSAAQIHYVLILAAWRCGIGIPIPPNCASSFSASAEAYTVSQMNSAGRFEKVNFRVSD